MRNRILLSRAIDYAKQIDSEKIKKLIRTVQERIDFINLKTDTVNMMDVISNEEVVQIIYEFIKTRVMILNLGEIGENEPRLKRFTEIVTEVQKEIKKNKNKEDIKIVMLDQLLQKIFDKLEIADLNKLDDLSDELLNALNKARNINYENDRLSQNYGGDFGFVKTYQDSVELYTDTDKKDIEKMLLIVYQDIKDKLDNDVLIIQGRKNFIDSIKHNITKILLKEKLYLKVKNFYDQILSELYTNIQLFK